MVLPEGVVIRPSTRPASTILGLALLVAIALPPSADAHVVLGGEIARPMLVDIARKLKDSRDAPSEAGRLEALYLLGEKVRQLVELMNLDLLGHGQSLYADLLVKRLADYGVRIAFVERRRLYVSDLGPSTSTSGGPRGGRGRRTRGSGSSPKRSTARRAVARATSRRGTWRACGRPSRKRRASSRSIPSTSRSRMCGSSWRWITIVSPETAPIQRR
jgi:hypothetical protein